MCLAVPAKIIAREGTEEAWVTLGATTLRINLSITPEARIGDWVLVHAGFAIQQLDLAAVREIWEALGELDHAIAEVEMGPSAARRECVP